MTCKCDSKNCIYGLNFTFYSFFNPQTKLYGNKVVTLFKDLSRRHFQFYCNKLDLNLSLCKLPYIYIQKHIQKQLRNWNEECKKCDNDDNNNAFRVWGRNGKCHLHFVTRLIFNKKKLPLLLLRRLGLSEKCIPSFKWWWFSFHSFPAIE